MLDIALCQTVEFHFILLLCMHNVISLCYDNCYDALIKVKLNNTLSLFQVHCEVCIGLRLMISLVSSYGFRYCPFENYIKKTYCIEVLIIEPTVL